MMAHDAGIAMGQGRINVKISPMQVTLIDSMGTDLSVVNAARVSFDKESYWTEVEISEEDEHGWYKEVMLELNDKDAKLIKYLATHKHTSPFNHCFATFRVKAPVFVARQLVKHKFLPWNEVSRRYVDSEPEFYVPNMWRKKAVNVKQGSSDEPVVLDFVRGKCANCGTAYTPKSPNQKFCSVNCQANKYRELRPFETKWTRWKASAKARGYEFTITEDDVAWPDVCPYLGIKLDYAASNDRQDDTCSLDRIDSTRGYVPGNVQIISSKANRLKNDASISELETFAKNVLLMHKGVIVNEDTSVLGVYQTALDAYNKALSDGCCPEQARMFLPLSTMTEWIWSGTLGAIADMCRLRLDSHSQQETRQVAEMIAAEMSKLYPVAWAALMEIK